MTSVRWRDLPDGSEDDEDDNGGQYQQYEQTLMYGRYTRDLGDYAKEEAKKIKKDKFTTIGHDLPDFHSYHRQTPNKCHLFFRTLWKHTFARVGEDWVFLAVLGILMACVSFLMDLGISICNKARIWLYRDLASSNLILQYLSWVSLPVCLILFSAAFVHLTAPQAVGSGIPEMKTILRGVVLKEYLTFKTFIAKIIGLTATLGTGLPLGKEGPFVHIASIVATILSKAVTSFKGIYTNESRHSEMLAAACAVGVACSFAAPIGGVLFSIEVTSVYFAVRNYWRGFFAAVCGAMMFRLLAVWFNDEETLTAFCKTNFSDYPFDPMELFAFAITGIACGFLGAFFVRVHRHYVMFMRRNKKMKTFLQKSRLLYPFLVTLIYASLSFPPGFGQFIAGDLTTHSQVVELFSNITWTNENHTVHEFGIVENWRTQWTNIFVNLILYIIFTFTVSVVASTLPVPSGIFIPVLKIGAALGRIVGESMAVVFPSGLSYGGIKHIIVPGGYSIVGAAAFAGAVTHTISTSVIVFELTGQITHILPVMIAVLIANGIAQLIQPSIYDSIIRIKKLPYLPDILTSTSRAYNMFVEDFMVRDVKYIWYGITYKELKNILIHNKKIRALPLVDSPDSMVLLGSIQRTELIELIEDHMRKNRSAKIVGKWKNAAHKDDEENGRYLFQKGIVASVLPDVGFTALTATGFWYIETPATKRKKDFPVNNFESLKLSSTNADNSTNGEIKVQLDQSEVEPYKNRNESYRNQENSYKNEEELDKNEEKFLPNEEISSSIPLITTTDTVGNICRFSSVEALDFSKVKKRPSRFAVTKVETPSKNSKSESTVTLQVDPVQIRSKVESSNDSNVQENNTLPRKSILKKTRSFIFQPSPESPFISPQPTPYVTVHAGDSKLRNVIEAVMRKRNMSKLEFRSNPKFSTTPPRDQTQYLQITPELLWRKTMEQQWKWEEELMDRKADFTKCQVDPSPFQLVERTSLLKVHSLFSMLHLNHAYVTAIGRLIGVVALKELRKAIEETNLGEFTKSETEAGRESSSSSLRTEPSSMESKNH